MYPFDPFDPWRPYRVPKKQRVRVHRPQEQAEITPAPQPEQSASQAAEKPARAAAGEEAATGKEHEARLQAELENTKKRLEKRFETEAAQYRQALLREMLPLADHLRAALQHSTAGGQEASLRQGVELTLRAFHSTLQKYGVVPLDPTGEPFDPSLHEAVGQIQSEGVPSGHVAKVVQTGYTIDGELLRPAQVIVAA